MQLQKATRKQVKLKLGLSAVAGGGKTKGALLLAKGLCGDWKKSPLLIPKTIQHHCTVIWGLLTHLN
jgi:hypothetical protein